MVSQESDGWIEHKINPQLQLQVTVGVEHLRDHLVMSVPLLRHDPSLTPAQLEEQSVHSVYESIAPHFSQTRHKPWPLIARFLHSLPAGTIGLDSGAGNGKYLPDAEGGGRRVAVALDRSQGLLEIARHAGRDGPKGKGRDGGEPEQVDEREYDCVRGDLGYTGWRQGVFVSCTPPSPWSSPCATLRTP